MDYLIKSSALIIVFYLCYNLLLQRDTFFQNNRWFLLSGLIISFCLPLIIIPIHITKEISAQFTNINTTTIIENAHIETLFNWVNILIFIYFSGLLFLSLRLIFQLLSLTFKLSKGSSKKQDDYVFVETNEAIAPFSFFNYIVYNPSDFNNKELEHIINHEKVHANQNHSIDILISHLVSIICWFNPIVWLYKKDLQQNLEFIADHEALSNSKCRKTYQYVLLKTSVPNYQMSLTNNFYNSLIKKRIVMLHKNKSKKRNQIKMVLILPILAIFLMSFSTKEIITYKTVETNITEATTETTPEIALSEMEHEKSNIISTTKKNINTKSNQKKITKKEDTKGDVDIVIITKDMSSKELSDISSRFKKNGITLKFKNIKRNKNNEITDIDIIAKTKNSNSTFSESHGDAIKPITIKIKDGSISIDNGHQHEHRDYHFSTGDGDAKIHKSKSGSNVFVHTDSDDHDDHEVIVEDDKIIIKKDGKIKEVKKVGKDKTIWIKDDEHDIIEIKEEENNGQTVIIKKGKDGEIIKSSSKSLWISNDDEHQEHSIFETKEGDHKIFITRNNHGEKALYVINGKIIGKGKLNNLDPNNIKYTHVLKGEAAIKKYGKKGKDGVIEITTKDN